MNAFTNAKLLAVDVKAKGRTFEAGSPRELFDTGYVNLPAGGHYHPYAVSPDGERFLVPRPPSIDVTSSPPIVVVLNWVDGIGK